MTIVKNALSKGLVGKFVLIVGGLSLEMYLVGFLAKQWMFYTAFPVCYFVGFLFSLSLAYLTRCMARFFAQTFNRAADYDWREIVSLI